jgi:hypothetical protein
MECDLLKVKLETRNCNGAMKWKLRKTGNEYCSEITWEWLVRARDGTVVQEHAEKVDKKLGRN